jgi:hypothetical protein
VNAGAVEDVVESGAEGVLPEAWVVLVVALPPVGVLVLMVVDGVGAGVAGPEGLEPDPPGPEPEPEVVDEQPARAKAIAPRAMTRRIMNEWFTKIPSHPDGGEPTVLELSVRKAMISA